MAGFHTKERILSEWREWFRRRRDDGEYQKKIIGDLLAHDLTMAECDVVEEMNEEYHATLHRLVDVAESQCPIGLKFKPSWEQAQVLNAWHPDFEHEIAPNGYRSICNFSANRSLKTSGCLVDTLLWIIPNDPDWWIFEEFEDEEGRKHGNDRGRYRVRQRPDWEHWIRTGRMIYPGLAEPPKKACEIWQGVENDEAWNGKVLKELLKWMPPGAVGKRPDGGTAIDIQKRRLTTKWGHTITGKTYNSDMQDWAGHAVWRVNMDEGFDQRIFNEALLRIQANGYFHWTYTVAEARNIGSRAQLANAVYRGKHRLVGQAKFFTDFRLDYVPEWAMPAQKKADDIARLSQEGAEGKVRLYGGFFESSPTVFSNFERERNILPIDGGEVLLAMRGEVPARWTKEFGHARADRLQFALYQANILRGFDEGLANPSAATWQALLRTGEYVTFREWEQSDTSIEERCIQVIERSGNLRVLVNPGAPEQRRRYKEVPPKDGGGMAIRKTFADSKMFVRDPLSPADDFTENYIRLGLKIERAGNIRPGPRCDAVNDMLRADPTRQHLLDANQTGTSMYVTRDCMKVIERLENYLWQQIAQGQRAGEFTDKPENKDDHTVDAFCYPPISKLRWRDPEVVYVDTVRRDPVTGYISR